MNFVIEGADSKTGKNRRIEIEAADEKTALSKAKASGVGPHRVEAAPPILKVEPRKPPAELPSQSDAKPVFTSDEHWTEALTRVNANSGRCPDAPLRCPGCRSTELTANKQGFGLGKAALGGVALGPVGLLGGFIGSGKVKITCLKCGKVFLPGQGK